MNEMYKEWLVKRETTKLETIGRYALIGIAVICFILGIIGNIILFVLGILLIAIAYYVYLNTDLEYEYLYVDKEISVDKIMARSKRKKLEAFSVERMQVMAPVKSHRLDSFNNVNLKISDFSSRKEVPINPCYAMVYEGNRKIILEAPRDFMKAIYQVAPRKVFFD